MTEISILLHDSAVWYLPNSYPLDERPVSSHPADARGYAPRNCYVVKDGDQAAVIETGFTIHRDQVLAQLAGIIDDDTEVTLLHLCFGEFGSVCNARPIAERFKVTRIASAWREPVAPWMEVDPDYVRWGEPATGGPLNDIRYETLAGKDSVAVGPRSDRHLDVVRQHLQLLPFHWLFDRRSGTMFTTEAFSHVWREDKGGPWIVDEQNDDTTREQIRDYLLGSRFWWLAGARTDLIIKRIDEIFAQRDVRCIAPTWGCVLRGKPTVDRHVRLLTDVLRQLADEEPIGPTISPVRAA